VKGEEFFDAVKFGQTALGKTPKGFDAVDVDTTGSKSFGLVDADMLVVADVDEAIVTTPVVGENDAGRIDLAAQDGVERVGGAVGDDLGVDPTLAFVDAEDRLLEGAATAFTRSMTTAQTSGAKITFIGFDHPDETTQLGELMGGNETTKKGVMSINGYCG